MQKHWYAVYTKPQQELKTAATLTKKKMEAFCPQRNILLNRGFGRKLVQQPLFPSLVFVCITEAEIAAVRSTNEVINFIYWLGAPAIIKDAEIHSLQQFTATYNNLVIEKIPVVRLVPAPGAGVQLLPVISKQEDPAKVTVSLTLPSLGYRLIAERQAASVVSHTSLVNDWDNN